MEVDTLVAARAIMTRKKTVKKHHPKMSPGKDIHQLTLPVRLGFGRLLDRLRQLPPRHRLAILILLPLWLLLLAWQPAPPQPPSPVTGSLSLPLAQSEQRSLDIPNGGRRIDHTLGQGETLAALFREWQLPGQDLIALVRAEPSYKPLSRLQAGQDLTLVINAEGRLHYLEIRDNGLVLNAFRRLGQEFGAVTTP